MKPLFVAHNHGPCRAFEAVLERLPLASSVLLKGGHIARPSDEELTSMVREASMLVCGISSEEDAAIELHACQLAFGMSKPIVLFSDMFRNWAKGYATKNLVIADALLVVSPDEVANGPGVPRRVICTGNPAWERFFQPGDCAGVRTRLGIGEDESMVLVPGIKFTPVTMGLFAGVVDSCGYRMNEIKPFVALAPQPQDPLKEVYEDMLDVAEVRGCVLPKEITTDMAVYGADVIVHHGLSSTGIFGIAQRIPVVDYFCPLARRRLAQETGTTRTPFDGMSVTYDGRDSAGKLYGALRGALARDERGRHPLQGNQEEFLPTINQGEYVEKFIRALEEIAP